MDDVRSVDEGLLGMLDAMPERIARFSLNDFTVHYCNAIKAAEYGLTPPQLIGRSLADVLDAPTLAELRSYLGQLGADRPVLTQIAEVPGPQDTTRWIEWIDQLHPDPRGTEVLSIGRDVTVREFARRQLHESEERFRLAMTDAPIGMALVGMDYRFLAVNQALCRLLGRSEDELLAMTTHDITHPDDVIDDITYGNAVVDGLTGQGLQKRFVKADGTVIHGLLRVSAVRTPSGQPAYVIGQLVDITDQIAHQEHLESAAEVERSAAERLRRLDEVKNAFLTAVSHELRTPLTIVRGMASTLTRLGSTLDADTRADLELAIERHAVALSTLLDDLLDVDRLARGKLTVDVELVDAAEILRVLVEDATIADRVRVTAPEQLWVHVDVVQFGRIVSNLLDNAGKYAPDGEVEVRLAAVGGRGFRLEVIDDGPGIDRDELQQVFEPFYRSDGEHPQPGTGVGLALVAEFARLHGGRAWAEPASSGG